MTQLCKRCHVEHAINKTSWLQFDFHLGAAGAGQRRGYSVYLLAVGVSIACTQSAVHSWCLNALLLYQSEAWRIRYVYGSAALVSSL